MIIKIKKSQVKSVFMLFLIFTLLITLIYAIGTTLVTPAENYVDDDGYLDLRAKCEPTSVNEHDGTTSWNITNATLYSNVDGTWEENKTIDVTPGVNVTYYFNFTNDINQSPEGEFKWDVQCHETNETNGIEINKVFDGNRTIIVRYARPTVTTISPASGTYDLDGWNILINCSATAYENWNITQLDLMRDGKSNQTYLLATPSESQVARGFYFASGDNESTADGTDVVFGCSATQRANISATGNEPYVTSEKSSVNRTIYIEFPPQATLESPADNNWSKNQRNRINFSVVSSFGTGISPFPCQIYSNDTGTWMAETGALQVTNNTNESQNVVFSEKTAIKWGVKCSDGNDGNVFNFTVNRTINIDATNPTITLISPTENITTRDTTPAFSFIVTDTNLVAVKLFFDEFALANFTNLSVVSGVSHEHTINVTLPEGNYNWSLWANDSSGREYQTANSTIIIDTTDPDISNIMNVSEEGYCDKRNINWSTDTDANYTIYLDTDTEVADGIIGTSSVSEKSHSYIFDFDFNAEILYYFNITSCDPAGNCNTSAQKTFTTPARVCTGWSQYSVYDDTISLSGIQNQSGADLVYFWNATNQDWVYYTAGLTTNEDVLMGKLTDYRVVHLYENTNSTWFRNVTTPKTWKPYNVSSVHNFISIPGYYTFGNLTESFMNASKVIPGIVGNASNNDMPDGTTYGPFNLTFFAAWNNSAQDYVSHIFNFTWANETVIEQCVNRINSITCMETIWVASDHNISWNGTDVYTNWTI